MASHGFIYANPSPKVCATLPGRKEQLVLRKKSCALRGFLYGKGGVCDIGKYSWDNLQEQEGIAESPKMLITEFRG